VTTILVDFDGTITEEDLLDRIAQTFGDSDVYREVDEGLDDGRLTLHEVLRREFEPVRAPVEVVVAWVLEHATVRPGFRELVETARERGWRLVILSSGFRQLIEPVLEREGLASVELLSNEVDPDPAGWKVRFRDSAVCPVCGEPCKRSTVFALADGGRSVYVGDGFSDQCAAEASDLVFARRRLAAYLTEREIPFESFADFHDVLRGLERAV
jgi:2,3-diketo-5-methylthio-1-phosphopentane phosphatase